MDKSLTEYSTVTQFSVKAWDRLFNHAGPINMPWIGYWLLYVGGLELLYTKLPGLALGLAGAGLLGSILIASGGLQR